MIRIFSKLITVATIAITLQACAGVEFRKDEPADGDAFGYYETIPYVVETIDKDCKRTVSVIAVPSEKRWITFDSGIGSAKLSATLSNGVISTVGQETDTQIPETITALTGMAKDAILPGVGVLGGAAADQDTVVICEPDAAMYPVDATGKPDPSKKIQLLAPKVRVIQPGAATQ